MCHQATETAKQAIALDPKTAEAYAVLGLVSANSYDWNRAEIEYATAVKLDPEFATAHQWYGLSLVYRGRFDEALRELRTAMRLDPVSMPLYAAEGMASYYARHYQAAIEIGHKALAMDSSFRNAHLLLGMALEAQHRPVEAEREYDGVGLASSGDAEALTRLAHLVCNDRAATPGTRHSGQAPGSGSQ
jgi:tetratricopeptide (TPR) repeat protein